MVIKNNSTVVERYRTKLLAAKKKLGKQKVTFAKKTDLTAKGEAIRMTNTEKTLTDSFKESLALDIKNMKKTSNALKKTDKSLK